jgi:hypothetical protein
MKIKNNIILKNSNRNLFSGTGLHRKGLLVDVRDHLKHSRDESVVVNNPTFGRVLSSKNNDDSVKIGTINESAKHPDTHSDLVDQFKKISFKDKKRNNIKLEL